VITRSRCAGLLLFVGVFLDAPVFAQAQPEVIPAASAGHVITNKTLADCKRRARIRKLDFIRQRHFIRTCAGG
jgi:hypothetical protein